MKMKKMVVLGSVVFAAILTFTFICGSGTSQAAEKVYRMKIQSAYPRGDYSMELLNEFAAAADKNSKGQIKIQVFAAPEIVPVENLFEATQKGTLTMLHAVAAMWGGIVPIGEVEFGLPYAYNLPGEPDVYKSGKQIRDFFMKTGLPSKVSTGWTCILTVPYSRCPPKRSPPAPTCRE
jgi:TRAP-type mannitol/chloroaromatic compound transport system substrate-binding protein